MYLNRVNVTLAAFGIFILIYGSAYWINQCFVIKSQSDLLF